MPTFADSYYRAAETDLRDDRLAELRPGQHGAVRALQGWALSSEPQRPGFVVLPTGYGKSELIALAPYLFGAKRTLVVAPSEIVREQLAERVRSRRHLVAASIVASQPSPSVLVRRTVLRTTDAWQKLEEYDVVVAHPSSVSPALARVVEPHDQDLFDLLILDEAHHLGAASWRRIVETFPRAKVVGFTATPFRRDRRSLDETVVFDYPLAKAVAEKFFAPITYRQVTGGLTRDERDRAVARAAIDESKRRDKQHGPAARLLVRSETIERAEQLVGLYRELSGGRVILECITHKTSRTAYADAMDRLGSGVSGGVSFVGVLGEGFDLPSLKIAAYHAAHRSLPATIQFAGRVARNVPTQEDALLIAAEDDHPQVVRALHRDKEQWDLLIPALAEQLRRAPTRMSWATDEDVDVIDDMSDAFTAENARFFQLADIYCLDQSLEMDAAVARIADCVFEAPVIGVTGGIDTARCVKSLVAPNQWAGLFHRHRPVRWLADTPPSYMEHDTAIVVVVDRDDGGQWLFIRSTLGAELTRRVLDRFVGYRPGSPPKSTLARYGDWATARVTSLGKRTLHPVIAGVQSYEIGAGEDVAAAVTADDRATNEAGHLIAVHGTGPSSRQLGIALNRRRLWETGLPSFPEYARWASGVANALDSDAEIGELAGLRISGGTLSPDARPVGVVLDPTPSRWELHYIDTNGEAFPLADAKLVALRQQRQGDVTVTMTSLEKTQPFLTLVFAPDGQLRPVLGFIERFGYQVECHHWFETHPPQIFFDDGSVLRGPGGHLAPTSDLGDVFFPIADHPTQLRTDAALHARNRILAVDRAVALLPEKPAGNQSVMLSTLASVRASTTPITSLFESIVKTLRPQHPDFIFCDDGSGEVADFIVGWHSPDAARTATLLLVHAKAASLSLRRALSADAPDPGTGTTLEAAQEVAQQALRSIEFLNRPSAHMLRGLDTRSEARPTRWIHGARTDAQQIFEDARRVAEIRVVHPGFNYSQMKGTAGRRVRTLFGSIRARAQASRAELTLVVRHCP